MGQTLRQPLITPRNLDSDFEAEGELVHMPEEQTLLKKMRTEKLAKEKRKAIVNEQGKSNMGKEEKVICLEVTL